MYNFIPPIIIAAILLITIVTIKFFKYQSARKGLRAPFTQKLERFPGQSLLKRLDELNLEISIQAAALLAVPIAMYAGYISHLCFAKRQIVLLDAAIVTAITAIFLIYSLLKIRRLLQERKLVRLRYEGELTVGQTLNRLMRAGYRVYHDFPADKFNIDHIVVGEKGVFAVETKTRSKRTTTNRTLDATVEYDGRALHFPSGTNTEMIAQAKRQSKWLSGWLGQAIGEEIAVRAIIALPGWFVKRTAPEGMPVVNPKQFDSLFQHIQPRPLTEELITRITHQLDQKCGDIEPLSMGS